MCMVVCTGRAHIVPIAEIESLIAPVGIIADQANQGDHVDHSLHKY
jgi:hypothetical protein